MNFQKETKKNTKRGVTLAVRREVYERDGGCCILCGSTHLERVPHHCFYGQETNYGPNRNDADQLVIICIPCHTDIHDKGDDEKRRNCKEYLENIPKTLL